jgi:membrane protein implicated in regulation of membrane protease activity
MTSLKRVALLPSLTLLGTKTLRLWTSSRTVASWLLQLQLQLQLLLLLLHMALALMLIIREEEKEEEEAGEESENEGGDVLVLVLVQVFEDCYHHVYHNIAIPANSHRVLVLVS